MKRAVLISFFWLCLGVAVCSLSSIPARAASEVNVSPQVIDERTKARDILEYELTVKNEADHYLDIYVFVNDVNSENGKQDFTDPSVLDKTTSIASWLKVSRGVIELGPGETKKVPVTINVNLSAKPGQRHAVITFAPGSNRPIAEKAALVGNQAQTIINLEVFEEIVEKAQVKEFTAERTTYFKFPVNIKLNIQNNGNRPIQPVGYIYFYDRRGEEVGRLTVNADGGQIQPEASQNFDQHWYADSLFGKYRAKLELEYGESGMRDLQDTIYFWIMPLKLILALAGGIFVLIILLTVYLFKKTYHHPIAGTHQRHYPVINLRKGH